MEFDSQHGLLDGGQDDITWDWGTDLGNGTWHYRVNASAHNNEGGYYRTHIYFYDKLGNSRDIELSDTYVDRAAPTYSSVEVKNVTKDRI